MQIVKVSRIYMLAWKSPYFAPVFGMLHIYLHFIDKCWRCNVQLHSDEMRLVGNMHWNCSIDHHGLSSAGIHIKSSPLMLYQSIDSHIMVCVLEMKN